MIMELLQMPSHVKMIIYMNALLLALWLAEIYCEYSNLAAPTLHWLEIHKCKTTVKSI